MSFVGDMLGLSPTSSFQATGGDLSGSNKNVQDSYKRQQDFVDALTQQRALTHQFDVFGQQQNLANQLQGVANGTGPNPALAQLNQATGANVANQAALMASQRGTGANAGALARL